MATIPCIFKFSSKLFKFLIGNADIFLLEQMQNNDIDDRMITGFSNFLECLNLYKTDNFEISNESKVTIYGTITLENGAIIRATSSYHGRPLFSNVSVCMNSDELHDYASDQGICYGQVII